MGNPARESGSGRGGKFKAMRDAPRRGSGHRLPDLGGMGFELGRRGSREVGAPPKAAPSAPTIRPPNLMNRSINAHASTAFDRPVHFRETKYGVSAYPTAVSRESIPTNSPTPIASSVNTSRCPAVSSPRDSPTWSRPSTGRCPLSYHRARLACAPQGDLHSGAHAPSPRTRVGSFRFPVGGVSEARASHAWRMPRHAAALAPVDHARLARVEVALTSHPTPDGPSARRAHGQAVTARCPNQTRLAGALRPRFREGRRSHGHQRHALAFASRRLRENLGSLAARAASLLRLRAPAGTTDAED